MSEHYMQYVELGLLIFFLLILVFVAIYDFLYAKEIRKIRNQWDTFIPDRISRIINANISMTLISILVVLLFILIRVVST